MANIEFDLSYDGNLALDHALDFYDATQALVGFQRSLAITTHLILNDQVITQAPSMKGAAILLVPPEAGSWKVTAVVSLSATALFSLGTAPKDTVIGNLVSSAYDYVISNTLGFHVDYDKTLGRQYEELKERSISVPQLSASRFESVMEKCEVAVREMHRPIVKSGSAEIANISSVVGGERRVFPYELNHFTYDFLGPATEADAEEEFVGKISSYNLNTFKGRVFIGNELRPVSFEVAEAARHPRTIMAITSSLSENARSHDAPMAALRFRGTPFLTRTGRLRSILISSIDA